MSLYIFSISTNYVTGRGWGNAEVIAPSAPAALEAASVLDYIVSEADKVEVSRERGAVCDHTDAYGNDGVWHCEWCRETWSLDGYYPEPSATDYAFRIYCKNLAETGQFGHY